MSDIVDAIRGAFALAFSGFILIVLAQAFAGTTLDTGTIQLGMVGILAIVGGALVFLTAIAALISKILTEL